MYDIPGVCSFMATIITIGIIIYTVAKIAKITISGIKHVFSRDSIVEYGSYYTV